jgi:Flp pilus assembly pilin Flp
MQTRARARSAAGGDTGASVVEYALILVGVAAVLVGVVVGLRSAMTGTFTKAQTNIAKDQASLILNKVGAQPPTGLTAKPGNAQIELNWDDMISSTSYTVSGCGATFDVTDSAAICTGLTNGTLYLISVTASGPGGTSTPSSASATPLAPPGAPTGVTVTLTTTTGKITWAATPTASSYNVYGCGVSIFVVTDPVVGYTCTRPVGSSYTITVTAVNAGGESPPSSSVTVPQSPPNAPTNLVATPGNRTLVLTWDAMPGATGYSITGCGASITPSANPSGTTATCSNLTNGQTYTVSVTANGAGGSSAPSTVSAKPVAPPTAPTSLRIQSSNSTTVTLTWNAPTGAVSYNVYGCGFADTSATTTYVCTRPPSGTWTVTVTAVNAGGESPPSNSVSVTPGPPSPPTNLVGTPGNRTIVLTWDAMPGATSYSITGCGNSIAPSANLSGTTATCNLLTNGNTYTVSVTSTGPGGTSAASTVTVQVPWRVVHSGNNNLTQTWSNPPDTAVPNNYNFSSCTDSLNSANITCGYSNGNLTMSTNRNTPLGPVTLTWTFTRNGRPNVVYTETFIIS